MSEPLLVLVLHHRFSNNFSFQIDEPVMVRFPKEALTYGIDQLAKCFEGVGEDVIKCIHLCCGYPNHLVC